MPEIFRKDERNDGPERTSIPSSDEVRQSELDLMAEWLRQAGANAALYADVLGLSQEEYIARLPRFAPQPIEYKGKLDTSVIVQVPVLGRLDLRTMLELLGVKTQGNVGEVVDWESDAQGFQTPAETYTAWLGRIRLTAKKQRTPSTVRQIFAPNVRGGTIYDGLALYAINPNAVSTSLLYFPGSEMGSGSAPYLCGWEGKTILGRGWLKSVNANDRCIVAGRQIVTAPPMGK